MVHMKLNSFLELNDFCSSHFSELGISYVRFVEY